MKNQFSIFKFVIIALLAITPSLLFAQRMVKHIDKVQLSATPQILEQKGNNVTVTIKAEFPPKYFEKKVVMNITPTLMYDNGQTELPSINFIGEKVTGNGTEVSKRFGGTYTYTTTIPYNDNMQNSILIIEPIVYDFKTVVHPNRESIKAKEKYTLCDAFLVAQGTITTAQEIDKNNLKVAYTQPVQEQVVMTDNGDIYFLVNSDNINWNVPLNKHTHNISALQDMTSNINKGWDVKNIVITGWASPEGPIVYNDNLSENRAKMVEQYVKKKLANYDNINNIQIVVTGAGPDWNGLMTAIQNSNLKDKTNIITTLKSQTPEQRVAQLNNYIEQYPELENTILPSLRRVVINVNTIEPTLSNQQITTMSNTNPSSLTCNQMIYSASMAKERKNKDMLYITAMETYPDCPEPYCNAGAVAIEMGDTKRAKQLLHRSLELDDLLAEAYNNLGVVAIFENNYPAAAAFFEQAQDLGLTTDYNMGIVEINNGNYPQAVKMMKNENPNCDYNIALAQTLDKKYTLAEETIKCTEESGKTLYLQAIMAARTKNIDKVYQHLAKAIKKDTKFKDKAKNDMEFALLQNDATFIDIVE